MMLENQKFGLFATILTCLAGWATAEAGDSRFACNVIPFPVANESDLFVAIDSANDEISCPGPDVIDLGGNTISLTGELPDVLTSVTIQNGAIQRSSSAASNFRLLYINAGDGSVSLTDLFLANGNASYGAALYVVSGNVNIEGSAIWNNTSSYGAVRAFATNSRITISDSSFNFNSADANGGALALSSGAEGFVVNTAFTDNSAGIDGGAVHLSAGSRLMMINVALRGNEALDDGGAIYTGGDTDLINVLIAGNFASNRGGGLYVIDDMNEATDLELLNVTISGNRAVNISGGGGIRMQSGDADVDNTIVWSNLSGTAGGFASDNVAVNATDATIGFSRSILEGGTPSGAVNDDTNYYTDPFFVDPTIPDTSNVPNSSGNYRVFEGSPGIDAGKNLDVAGGRSISSIEHDLDRTQRILNGIVDLGAYEGGEPLVFPDVVPSPDVIDFGTVSPSQSSPAETVVVSNLGDAAVVINGITVEGAAAPDFQIVPGSDQCTGQTINPSATCQFEIRFVPQDVGVRNARTRIASDDPDGPAFVDLLGASGVLFFDGFEG